MIRPNVRPHGQVRHSQVVTTFGPGSLLDLPRHSVIVGGLDFWTGVSEEVHEPRLGEKIKRLLSLPALKLFSPPPDSDDSTAPRTGITVWQFPEWFITQDVERGGLTRSRLLVHRKALTKGKFIDADRRKRPVVPIRFVRACRKGHVGDIDWYGFVHRGQTPCRRQLWMDERGTSGDLGEITIRCECAQERRLKDATMPGVLGHCDGSRPWLGPYTKESCDELNRMLVRHASNAYFPQIMSVISLPDRNETLEKAVNQVWENFLQYVDTLDELKKERQKKPPVKAALEGFTDEEVMQEIEARKGTGDESPIRSVKQAEFEVLATAKDEVGQDTPDGDYFARALPKSVWDKPWMASVERIVLVHRLREVVAQLGFTRFEASSPDVEGELQMGVVTAPLARELSWLPAVENRGEGVFIQFRKSAVQEWAARPEIVERGRRLRAGFDSWLQQHPHSRREFPGLPYYLLHSLSHLLLTAVSLECGYPASSIRERVYALEAGYGILLYTGSPDAEGTLGGLIEAGRQIERQLHAALELGRLCSNDPVCAQHDPQSLHECRFLHGAACHGCLLIAEPSCEQHNDFLDRALVVPHGRGRGRGVLQDNAAMRDDLEFLTDADLATIAAAIRSGRLTAPFTPVSVRRYCATLQATEAAAQLQQLHEEGMQPQHLALLAEMIVRTRRHQPQEANLVDLVWTGPQTPGAAIRDTGVVVRELFGAAENEVLVAGFAVYQGREVFNRLAERMSERPSLRVRFFLDVHRDSGDTSLADEVLYRFTRRFQTQEWPGGRLPELYYDPRSLDLEVAKRSSLHAKCIVVDRRVAFITSANFTEAAQTRNIEIGALIRCEQFAARLIGHFEMLVAAGLLKSADVL